MSKPNTSRFGIIVVIVAALILVGALVTTYLVLDGSDDQTNNTDSSSQVDANESLDTATSNTIEDIEKELETLSEEDYSDSGLSDSTLYE